MRPFPRPITRRAAGKLLAALPAAAALPSWASPSTAEDKPSAEADFIAAHEPGLSPEERERLKKALVEQERHSRPSVGSSCRWTSVPHFGSIR